MKLRQYYEAQTALLKLERRSGGLSEEIKEKKFDLRDREERLLQYPGSLRSLADRIAGKREDTLETLRREVRKAEAELSALRREREAIEVQRQEQTRLLQALPSPEELRAEAEPSRWAQLEAAFCAEALLPLLDDNEKALLEYRSLLRGEYPGISIDRKQTIIAQPDIRARKCSVYLPRLKEAMDLLGQPFTPGSYFEAPAAYLMSPAAAHNRRDRVNQALDQVQELQQRLRSLRA